MHLWDYHVLYHCKFVEFVFKKQIKYISLKIQQRNVELFSDQNILVGISFLSSTTNPKEVGLLDKNYYFVTFERFLFLKMFCQHFFLLLSVIVLSLIGSMFSMILIDWLFSPQAAKFKLYQIYTLWCICKAAKSLPSVSCISFVNYNCSHLFDRDDLM